MSQAPQPARRQSPPWRTDAPRPSGPAPAAPPPSRPAGAPHPSSLPPGYPQPASPQQPPANAPAGLHPDLAALLSEYDKIVTAFEQGFVSEQDALALLAALVVVDATGAHWALDEHRTFTVRSTPDAPARQADPASFASFHAVQPAPAGPPGYDPAAVYTPDRSRGARRRFDTPRWLTDLTGMLARNKVTVVVALVAVAVVFAAFAVRGSSSESPPTSVPVEAALPVPTKENADAVFAALASSDPAGLVPVFAQPPAGPATVLEHARFAGLAALGVSMTAGEATGDGSSATQPFVLLDATGAQIGSGALSWVQLEGRWVLAAWPTLAPA